MTIFPHHPSPLSCLAVLGYANGFTHWAVVEWGPAHPTGSEIVHDAADILKTGDLVTVSNRVTGCVYQVSIGPGRTPQPLGQPPKAMMSEQKDETQ